MSEKTMVIFCDLNEKVSDVLGKIGIENFHKAHEVIVIDRSRNYLEVVKSRSGDTFDRIVDFVLGDI